MRTRRSARHGANDEMPLPLLIGEIGHRVDSAATGWKNERCILAGKKCGRGIGGEDELAHVVGERRHRLQDGATAVRADKRPIRSQLTHRYCTVSERTCLASKASPGPPICLRPAR